MTPKFSLEIEGSTVEDAIKKALKQLKLPRSKVKIEVLSEEEKGLFGMPGAKPAKVRVSIIRDSAAGGSAFGGKENT
ncbi:MAG: Jag N-terminal domain-containing protein [Candidatus Omnitrophica bacterium]|nr:Jag N-terminal domain-containing protein [Candidatus Omnitrophota bacterium]MDD5592482.1 Jag N-terminal domain-containing protein [Candidatus Omnitrophota bacterium]